MDDLTPAQRKRICSVSDRKILKLKFCCVKHYGIRACDTGRTLKICPGNLILYLQNKIAIFVDGDFWHAHGHEERPGEQIATNSNYWKAKMKRNVERDRYVNELLLEQGWLVLRFWESDIKRNLESCVDEVMEYF